MNMCVQTVLNSVGILLIFCTDIVNEIPKCLYPEAIDVQNGESKEMRPKQSSSTTKTCPDVDFGIQFLH